MPESVCEFVVAGTAGNVEQKTIALAVMAAVRNCGPFVHPFKCAPGFMDGSHHF